MKSRAAFHRDQNWYRLRTVETVRVRIFSHRGHYPADRISLPSGFFHADASIALLATCGVGWDHYLEDCGFDEFQSPFPAESAFMASVILCEKPDEPCVRFYPLNYPVLLLDPDTVDVTNAKSQDEIVALVRDKKSWPMKPSLLTSHRDAVSQDLDLFEASALDLASIEQVWSQILPTNFVLLRGMMALMKSDMLSQHREFGAEALMSLYIALECSFQLVLEHLKVAGNPCPTATDAAKWVHEVFDRHFSIDVPDPTYKYFQEYYEGRVVMFHPRSRFGDLPYAPNFWDDVVHLRRSLPGIFYFLLTGSHSPGFLGAVDEFNGKVGSR